MRIMELYRRLLPLKNPFQTISFLLNKLHGYEDVVPIEYASGGETEESWEPKLQEAKGQQMYLNNIHGKEILQNKVNSIPRGLVPLQNIFYPNNVSKEP